MLLLLLLLLMLLLLPPLLPLLLLLLPSCSVPTLFRRFTGARLNKSGTSASFSTPLSTASAADVRLLRPVTHVGPSELRA